MKLPSGGERPGCHVVGSHPEFLSSSASAGLTSDQLSALPARNKELHILAYIQEQRAYMKHCISGQQKTTPWQQAESQRTPDLASPEIEGHLDNFNFGTPVLKARISQPGNSFAAVGPQKDGIARSPVGRCLMQNMQQRVGEIFHLGNPQKYTLRNRGTESEDVHKDGTKRRTPRVEVHHSSNTITNHPETERTKRLEERRQRKRAKRDAIKSPPNPDKENIDEDLKKKTGEKTQKKLQAGFALMHGLSVTNVGRSRLTLNPLLQNVGVFKKGKASGVAKIEKKMSKKRDISNVHFSELKFLGKRARKVSQESSTQSSTSANTRSDFPNKKLHKPLVERTTRQDKGQGSEVESVRMKTSDSRKPYNPEESIIWDIEKESHTADADHRASSDHTQGSIVVKFCVGNPDRSAHAKESALAEDDLATSMGWVPIPQNRVANGDSSDHMSLGPSQSASQTHVPEIESERQALGDASKYFKELATTPIRLFKLPEVHNLPSEEYLVQPPHVMDFRASHPLSICCSPRKVPEGCLTTIEPHCDSMEIDGANCLHAYSTHVGRGESSVSSFDFSVSPYPWLPHTWNVDDVGNFDSDLYQGYDMSADRCQIVHAETHEVNKQFEEEGFVLETPLDTFGTHRTHIDYETLQDEFEEEHGGDFQAGDAQLDCRIDNQEESDIQSEVSYNWTSQPSAGIRDGHLSEELEIYENSFCSSDFHPESDLVADNLNFYQGRSLLFGLSETCQGNLHAKSSNRLLNVEVEVAGSLKQNHWLPQR